MVTAPQADELLPWERPGEEPEGVGVCLSGGGVRAAAFSLGAVQRLQEERGLLFGPTSADHLAVVSGGSYTAAALMVNATNGAVTLAEPPLAHESKEEEHILGHGEYLKSWNTAADFTLAGLINLLAFVTIFGWAALIVVAWAVTFEKIGVPAHPWQIYALATAGFFGAGWVLFRGLYTDREVLRLVLRLLGGLAFVAVSPTIVKAIHRAQPLSDPGWWGESTHLLVAATLAAVLIAESFMLGRFLPGPVTRVVTALAVRVPGAIGFVTFGLLTAWIDDTVREGTSGVHVGTSVLLFVLFIGGAPLMGWVSRRSSLHALYRERLASCFMRRRTATGTASANTKLSDLAPPADPERRFPRLLVCATANVLWDEDSPEKTRLLDPRRIARRHRYGSFVFSHDRSGMPGIRNASHATTDLEALEVPRFHGSEKLLPLMSAIASTGAAVSPAMGKRSSPLWRALIALFNLRLGRWFPNPLSPRTRSKLAAKHGAWKPLSALGGGYDEFVPELLGLHRADASNIYVSDGGHYDNLGLIPLLRTRPAEVWCVDAQADKRGRATQLRNAVEQAAADLGVEIRLDLERFKGSGGVLEHTHAVGTIRYDEHNTGVLRVIKLGLISESDPKLFDHKDKDRGFPSHGTFTHLWYAPDRMEAYRLAGWESAGRALAELPLPVPPEPEDQAVVTARAVGEKVRRALHPVVKAVALVVAALLVLTGEPLLVVLAFGVLLLARWVPSLTELMVAARPMALPLIAAALAGGFALKPFQQVVLGVVVCLLLVPWVMSDWSKTGDILSATALAVSRAMVWIVQAFLVVLSLIAILALDHDALEWMGGAAVSINEAGGLPVGIALVSLAAWFAAGALRLAGYSKSPARLAIALLLLVLGVRVLIHEELLGGEDAIDWLPVQTCAVVLGVVVVLTAVLELLAPDGVLTKERDWRLTDRFRSAGLGIAIASAITLLCALLASAQDMEAKPLGAGHVKPPAVDVTSYSSERLATTFMPTLAFRRGQRWLPQTVDAYVRGGATLRDGRTRRAGTRVSTLPERCPATLAAPCFDLVCPSAGDPCALAQKDLADRPSADRHGAVYVRVTRARDPVPPFGARTKKLIQYWLFYPYDEWRSPVAGGLLVQQHAGDWEAITIGLGTPEKGPGRLVPLFAAFSQHCGGTWAYWNDVLVERDAHPLVGVALGSHANYQRPDRSRPPDWTSCSGVPGEAISLLTYAWNIRDRTALAWELQPEQITPVHVTARTYPMTFPGRWGKDDVTEFKGFATKELEHRPGPATPTFQPLWRTPMRRIFCSDAWHGPQHAPCP